MKEIYKSAQIDPLIDFMIAKSHEIQHSKSIKLDQLLNGFQFKNLNKLRPKILKIPTLKEQFNESLEKLAYLKNGYINFLSSHNSKIKTDLNGDENKEDQLHKFEKAYWKIIKQIRELFKIIEDSLNTLYDIFIRHLALDIMEIFRLKLNKKIFKITEILNLNKEIKFLDEDRNVNVPVFYDFLLAIGLVDSIKNNSYNMSINYLGFEKKEKDVRRMMLI